MTNVDYALEQISDGYALGLGLGRAANAFVRALGNRVRRGCVSAGFRPPRQPPTLRPSWAFP
jgi:ribose 5-phosphate isomerase